MAKQPAKGRKTPKKAAKAANATKPEPESSEPNLQLIDAIPAEVHMKPAASTAAAPTMPVVEEAEKSTEPEAEPAAAVSETPASKPQKQRSGFLPLVLGGLVAGVIGFVVGTQTAPTTDNGITEQIASQSAAIAALEARLAELDLAPVVADQDALRAELSEVAASIATVEIQLAELSDRPAVALDTSDPGTAAIADEMDALRAQIAEMTSAAQTELAEARAAAAAIEENAAQAARNAAARAALSRVQSAMESGAPLGAALNDLEQATGQPAPDALSSVRDGVPTLAALQEGFPDVARAALTTARSEGMAGEETTGFGAFLRNQFDVRSTTPQEGESADAVLSRAEAAVRNGRLADALAEISALPEVARGAMSDWLALAEARANAVAAVDILSTSLSDN